MANIGFRTEILPIQSQSQLVEAGLDEAGRGCMAGPVFAAAVILGETPIPHLNDSKKLSATKRNKLRLLIEKEALAWAVGVATVDEIDEHNILQACMLAMDRAIDQLTETPEFLAIDGNYFKTHKLIPYKTFIKGDGRYQNIAAASILAKTHRDEYMCNLHEQYPIYNWKANKGYGTKYHRDAILRNGRCPEHRKSFQLKSRQLNLLV